MNSKLNAIHFLFQLTNHEVMNELFSNITWSGTQLEVDDEIIVSHWTTSYTNIYVNLAIFIVMNVGVNIYLALIVMIYSCLQLYTLPIIFYSL